MIKLHNVKISGYDFTADVNVLDIPKDILNVINVDSDTWHSDYLKVEGNFSAHAYEDDYAEITDIEVTILGAPNGKTYTAKTGVERYKDERGLTYVRPIFGQVADHHAAAIEDDERFNIDALCDDISSQIDSHELWHEQQIAAADFMD